MSKETQLPWSFLEKYRGIAFNGTWPTFPELLRIQVKRFADRPYLTDFDGPGGSKNTLTWRQAFDKIEQLAKFMIEQGIQKGDKVAVTGKNSPEWAIVYLAALYASATIVPIDAGLHEEEAQNIINTALPKLIFADDDKIAFIEKNNPQAKVYCLTKPANENCTEGSVPPVKDIKSPEGFVPLVKDIKSPEGSVPPAKYNNPSGGSVPSKYVYSLKAGAEVLFNEPPHEDDIAAILFTSGTTGKPKGVMLSHANLISDGYIGQTNLFINHEDVFYALLPIHHAYTMQAAFICPTEVGAEIVFGKSMAVSKLMKELKEGKITIMLGVPLLYNKLMAGIQKGIKAQGVFVAGLLNMMGGISFIIKKLTKKNPGKVFFKSVLKKANIYSLRVAICGGGPLDPKVFRKYNEMGIDFVQGYGLTETSPIIALNPVKNFKIQSVGKDFYPYEEIKIINKEAIVSKKGAQIVGEIAVKGPMVMKGYYNMPDETKAMFTEDGFLKTGDLGWMDAQHYIMLCGRAKNLIVTSGGKNVYPEEIEDAFQMHTDVQQVTIQGYYLDRANTSEEIEALIYPSDELYKRLGCERNNDFVQDEVYEAIQKIVSKVNRTLKSYEQISKLTILKEPLEMTTTMKVKRNYVPKAYVIIGDKNRYKDR